MKQHPSLKVVVPPKQRLKVYKKALNIMENDPKKLEKMGNGLCLILPCILWNHKDCYQTAPDGFDWSYEQTSIAFSELTKRQIYNIDKLSGYETQKDARIQFIKKSIKKLENANN
jgi:hypothetical protein